MKKTYNETYNEVIGELKSLYKNRVGRNPVYLQEERDKRTHELWSKLYVPHGTLPKRGVKPMVHFGGAKDGQAIEPKIPID